jgi:hypothetical protein
MRDFERHLDACLDEGAPLTIVHACNPDRVRLRQYIDRFMAPNGINYPRKEWGLHGRPAVATPREVATTLKNFRRVIQRLRGDRRLRLLTVAEAVERYGKQSAIISRQELLAAARKILREKKIVQHERFTPAEILMAMAEAVLRCESEKTLPREIKRRDVLGPVRMPPWIPEVFHCDWKTLLQRARQLMEYVTKTGHLPDLLGRRWERVGPNHLYCALAEAFVSLADGRKPERLCLDANPLDHLTPRYPDIAEPIGLNYIHRMGDHLHDPNINVDAVYRHARLQTWTLKPAIPS